MVFTGNFYLCASGAEKNNFWSLWHSIERNNQIRHRRRPKHYTYHRGLQGRRRCNENRKSEGDAASTLNNVCLRRAGDQMKEAELNISK